MTSNQPVPPAIRNKVEKELLWESHRVYNAPDVAQAAQRLLNCSVELRESDEPALDEIAGLDYPGELQAFLNWASNKWQDLPLPKELTALEEVGARTECGCWEH